MVRIFNHRWIPVLAIFCVAAAAAVSSPGRAFAAPGSVEVSAQNSCTVGPTEAPSLPPSQTAFFWVIFQVPTTVEGYTYQITGTNNPFDSGILKARLSQCRKINVNDFWAKFATPPAPGEYTLTVFDEAGVKVSSDNFSVS
jgi:hypothetical protein